MHYLAYTKCHGKNFLSNLPAAHRLSQGCYNGNYSLRLPADLSEIAETSVSPKPTTKALKAVSALGRIEPQGEVILLSAPSSPEGVRIKELRVEVGSRIRAGDIIAILDNIDTRKAAFQQAEKQVEVYRMRLAQIEAGEKAGKIAAGYYFSFRNSITRRKNCYRKQRAPN
ncbi:MAG: biotin/lipoyl-binding protein [Oscillatoriaceae bacterium SKW80]|nr:biotin/lipoyl-binding protein [Oscillatoriaceae bacterium SKYG93]MCX8120274.1 biotin/lipoyl-binding protein [Oscillatoriaceae bacterium SKW80]MDW8453199.1 biotin/lipoyl-binding protein [Oscillatoriaceae cyanobacterium SKYGB_i_bin93]HIK28889.1 biotin/lipoyl-binding protein [Oscillatoriaceae cyanobacterium M7585_C2015_266]